MLEVEIRPALPDDLNLVRKSWMRSYRKAEAMQGVSDATYDQQMPERIARLIQSPRVQVLVASPPGDTLTAFGFIVASPPDTLHYLWVKESWRRMGIARRLVSHALPDGIARFTHLTRMGAGVWLSKAHNALYDPFGVES